MELLAVVLGMFLGAGLAFIFFAWWESHND